MAARIVRLSPLAEADLEDIWVYSLETWSLQQADAYLAELAAAFNGLADGETVGIGSLSAKAISNTLCGHTSCFIGPHRPASMSSAFFTSAWM